MKLKTVTLTHQYVIAVSDSSSPLECLLIAQELAHESVRDCYSYDLDVSIKDYERDEVPDWNDDCIPYGNDGNTTIGDYFED